MAYRLPSHLQRSRHGVLYFRIAIPADLRHHFATGEIYRSLRTPCVRQAAQAAQSLTIAFKRVLANSGTKPCPIRKKTPETTIDPDKLRELLLLTKQRFHYEEELDAQAARIAESERLLQVAKRQHERELNLVLQARTTEAATLVDANTDATGAPLLAHAGRPCSRN